MTSQNRNIVVCLVERVDIGRRQVGLQQHVRLVDGLPARDRRAVEHRAFVQEVLVDQIDVEGDVLKLALGVGEPDVDVFDVLVLDLLEDLVGRAHISMVLFLMGRREWPPPDRRPVA
jgi:hypothetical protein